MNKLEYKESYGRTVRVLTNRDIVGNTIDQSLKYVVTFYIDKDVGVVGIYPLVDSGYTKEELLSIQLVKHTVYIEELEEITGRGSVATT